MTGTVQRWKKMFLTWILCRAFEASATFCGRSKHLAVLILALTNHCWKSLRAARNLCSSKRSLFWHSRDARRLRLQKYIEIHTISRKINEDKHLTALSPYYGWGKAKNDMTNGQVEAWQSGWSGRNECWGNEWEWGMVVKPVMWGWGAEWQHMSGGQEFTGVANWRKGAMTD